MKIDPIIIQNETDINVPKRKSIKFRLTSFMVFLSMICGFFTLSTVGFIFYERLENYYIDNIESITELLALRITGDSIDYYLDTLTKDDSYERIFSFFQTVQQNTEVKRIYVSRFVQEGEIIVFDSAQDPDVYKDLGELEVWTADEHDMNILPLLLEGQTLEPRRYYTANDHLLTVREPIYNSDGNITAYLSVDVSMDPLNNERTLVLLSVAIAFVLLIVLSFALYSYVIRKIVICPLNILVDAVSIYQDASLTPEKFFVTKKVPLLTGGDEFEVLETSIMEMESHLESIVVQLREAEELTNLMLDSYPLCCQLWNRDIKTISCNNAAYKLYGFESKKEYIERFVVDCLPEFQPDGNRSDEKAAMLVRKAFDEGSCTFDWLHQMPDGTPMPAEVTLVRVKYKDDYLVAGYTRDMRDITRMVHQVRALEARVDEIFHDVLTGIYNRRYFEENLPNVINTLSLKNRQLSVLMIDIDYFKKYNDTYGHSMGDTCLKVVAAALTKSIERVSDFLARFGGEEFIIILPNTDETGVRIVVKRILDNVRQLAIPHKNSDVSDFVTISVGIAVGNVELGITGPQFVDYADKMLYQAKNNGRNQYVLGHITPDSVLHTDNG